AADQSEASLFAGHSFSLRRMSAGQTEILDEVVDSLDLVGGTRQGTLGVGSRILGLIAVAEHSIGAHQAQPAFDVVAIGMQPASQPLYHTADHLGALRLAHRLRRRN